jgi:hypothetical protein
LRVGRLRSEIALLSMRGEGAAKKREPRPSNQKILCKQDRDISNDYDDRALYSITLLDNLLESLNIFLDILGSNN